MFFSIIYSDKKLQLNVKWKMYILKNQQTQDLPRIGRISSATNGGSDRVIWWQSHGFQKAIYYLCLQKSSIFFYEMTLVKTDGQISTQVCLNYNLCTPIETNIIYFFICLICEKYSIQRCLKRLNLILQQNFQISFFFINSKFI